MERSRKYQFQWDLIGDIQSGRPNLGNLTRLEVYRLMQYTFRDVVEKRYGADETDRIFYDAGKLSGKHLYENMIAPVRSFDEFIKKVQDALKDLGIGIMRNEETNLEIGRFVVTISEDLDCSGLPEIEEEICNYDEGFLAGLFESYTGSQYQVKETDCWCTGDRTCRFVAEKIG